jgi:hypothetical protein
MLHCFPTELLREFVRYMGSDLNHAGQDVDFNRQPQLLMQCASIENQFQAQADRSRLLLINKSYQELANNVFYEDMIVVSNALERLLSCATLMRSPLPPRGHSTIKMTICRIAQPINLQSIISAFPNLKYLHLTGTSSISSNSWNNKWVSDITELRLTISVIWSDLLQISMRFSSLTLLHLLGDFLEYSPSPRPVIRFEALRGLNLGESFLTQISIASLELPMIRGLAMEVYGYSREGTFLGGLAYCITVLHIYSDVRKEFPRGLIWSCSQLQTFVFRPMGFVAAEDYDNDHGLDPHPSLQCLVIRVTVEEDAMCLLQHKSYLNSSRCPHIRLVRIIHDESFLVDKVREVSRLLFDTEKVSFI